MGTKKKKIDWKKTLKNIKDTSKEGYKKLDKAVGEVRKNVEEKDKEYKGGLGLLR